MRKITMFGMVALLAACGGGGDGGPSAPAATVEGFWEGATSTGYSVKLAVLESGETWGFYSSGSSLVGALYGNTQSSGSTLSGAGTDFNIPSRTVVSSTYSGTFSQRSAIRVTTANGTVFDGVYNGAYDQAPSLAALAGTFSGTGVSGSSPVQSANVTVSSTGAITVPGSGCSASGTATPRASGKNIFNVAVTFTGTNCALGNGTTANGIAYYSATTRQVLVMAMNSAKSDGFIYVGSK